MAIVFGSFSFIVIWFITFNDPIAAPPPFYTTLRHYFGGEPIPILILFVLPAISGTMFAYGFLTYLWGPLVLKGITEPRCPECGEHCQKCGYNLTGNIALVLASYSGGAGTCD